MVTNQEKNLYNTFLRISRTSQNKPFSYRKDFSTLDESSLLYTKRIYNLLSKYRHIKAEAYFLAPYKVYPNKEYFPLEFYAKMGGVSAYTMYMRQVQEMKPDSEEQLNFIAESLQFIGSHCIRNNISLDEYPTFKTGVTYDWMKQIKKHEISIYALMEFSKVGDIIGSAQEDEKELFLGDIGVDFGHYRSKYIQSKTAKTLVREGTKRIKKVISNKNN